MMAETATKWRLATKWQVVALGEDQQSGGVGATDTPPTQPELRDQGIEGFGTDNAENSIEQEVALQFWVDRAVDLLNRGKGPELIMAEFEHAGCPHPKEAVERAMQQPREALGLDQPEADQPVTAPQQQAAPAEVSETAMPQGVQAKTIEVEDLWGEKVAVTESIQDYDPYEIIHEALDGINSLPEPLDKSKVEARITQLQHLRSACRKVLTENQLDLKDEIEIDKLSHEAQLTILDLRGRVGGFEDSQYMASLPKFTYNAFAFEANEESVEPELRREPYDESRLAEDAAIFANELSPYVDAEGAATYHAKAYNIPVEPFVAAVKESAVREAPGEEHNNQRSAHSQNDESSADGPADALFL